MAIDKSQSNGGDGKARLTLADIQDEEDIYNRISIKRSKRQKLAQKSTLVTFGDKGLEDGDDVDDLSVISGSRRARMADRVDAMNIKFLSKKQRNKIARQNAEGEAEKSSDLGISSPDLFCDIGDESIDTATVCDMILTNFEKLKLDVNLQSDSAILLTKFRLFVFAVKYHQHDSFPLSRAERQKFVEVLNNLSRVKEFDYNYESKFVAPGAAQNSAVAEANQEEATREVRSIKIPKRILNMLNIKQG